MKRRVDKVPVRWSAFKQVYIIVIEIELWTGARGKSNRRRRRRRRRRRSSAISHQKFVRS